jgi:hypothetical protein
MGAAVPFKITKGTQFTGFGAKSSADLIEGQQVLATFTVEGTTNVARRFSATSEAVAEPRESTPPRPPSPPSHRPDLPSPPRDGPTMPQIPPEHPIPRDKGEPVPR